jgi:hypothetical protein
VQDVRTSLSATLVHDHIAIFSITVIGVPEPFFNPFGRWQSQTSATSNGHKTVKPPCDDAAPVNL